MFIVFANAQTLSVDAAAYNAIDLVQQILVGANSSITISNVKFNNVAIAAGSANNSNQIGFFNVNLLGNPNPLIFESGILLTSGGIENAIGPNKLLGATAAAIGPSFNTDPDLSSLSNSILDAAVLEFDIVPVSTSISFRYRFASEEYNANVCDVVNDAFGFFVSGPGITGAKNIALVPNTNIAVSVNTINMGPVIRNFNTGAYIFNDSVNCIFYNGGLQNWQSGKKYYQNNEFRIPVTAPPPNPNMYNLLQYNGLTVPLKAEIKNLQCGQTYHFKLAIADVGDSIYDSGVFIEAGSFESSDVAITNNSNLSDVNFNPYLLYEACVVDTITFTRDSSILTQQTFGISYVGSTADTSSTGDFSDAFGNPMALPSSIVFPTGQLKQNFILHTRQDNTIEPQEILKLKVLGQLGSNTCPFNNQPEAQFFIRDQPAVTALALRDSIYACPNAIVTLSGLVSGVLKNLDYTWSFDNNQVISKNRICKIKLDTLFTNFSQFSTQQIYFTGSDFCGNISIDTITISRQAYLPITAKSLTYDKPCAKDTVPLLVNIKGGVPPWYVSVFEKTAMNPPLSLNAFGDEDTLNFSTDTFSLALQSKVDAYYTIKLLDACRLSPASILLDTVRVGRGILPLRLDTLLDTMVVCQNQKLSFTLKSQGGIKPYRYFWTTNPIAIGFTNDSNFIFVPQNDTCLYYGFTDRCEDTLKQDSIFIQVSKVTANFENTIPAPNILGSNAQLGIYGATEFNNLSSSTDSLLSYEWLLNGVTISTAKNFKIVLDYNIDNRVQLITKNANACINVFEKRIAGQAMMYLPNVFTPNGDEVNDKFASINTGVMQYELKIYDRWGNLVFTSIDALAGWDGKIKDKYASDGTYFVVLSYQERETNKLQNYQGYLQIVGDK